MLDAIASIGKLQYSKDSDKLMDSLVRFRRVNPKDQMYYMVLDFSTTSLDCEIKLSEFQTNSDTPFYTPRYLNYIGIAPSNGLQYHATGHDLRHLCSQVLPTLLDKLPHDSDLSEKIRGILFNYFVVEDDSDPKNHFRYLLDLEVMALAASGFTAATRKGAEDKAQPDLVAKALLDHFKRNQQINPEQINLFAISIDGELVAKHPDYIRVALDDQVSMFDKAKDGICYITGQKTAVSAELTKFKFKYYITNTRNFSSNLTGKFDKNFQLSEAGVWQVLLGERYIMNHLRLRGGTFNIYMIPEFLDDVAYETGQIREAISNAYDQSRQLFSLKEANKLEIELEEKEIHNLADLDGIQTQMLLNFLFYEENKNEMKVYRHIKDVSPSRIRLMADKSKEVFKQYRSSMKHIRFHSASLESLYHLIPLMVDSKGKVKNPQMLMQLYDSILSGRRLDRRMLIREFVSLTSRVYHQSTGGLQVGNKRHLRYEPGSDLAWVQLILEQMQLLRWLEELNNLEWEGADNLLIELMNDLEQEQAHIQQSGFNSSKAALFLLGCMIKQVADAQYRSLKSKPILRKLNFKGISASALHRLVLEIYEKGIYYQRNGEYFPKLRFEMYHAEMKRMLDHAEKDWKLSDSENVFYILSGYSFLSGIDLKAYKSGKGSTEGELKEFALEEQSTEDEENENE